MTDRIDRLFAGALTLLGVFVVWKSLEYGYMRDATPGAGFFPLWIGLGLTVLSLINLVRSVRGTERLSAIFDRAGVYGPLAIVVAIAVFILLSPWIGMLLASALLIPAIALAMQPRWTARFAVTILAIAVAFPVLCYFLFAVYLNVPLQTGVLGF